MPPVGDYRLQVVDCCEGFNDGTKTASFKIRLRVVEIRSGGEGLAVDDVVFVVYMITGPGAVAGLPRVVAFCSAVAGIDPADTAAYDDFDPSRDFVGACAGDANAFAEAAGGNPAIGSIVDCRVTRGKDTPDGDYYREYAWSPVETA
jgi:hypothetical protein